MPVPHQQLREVVGDVLLAPALERHRDDLRGRSRRRRVRRGGAPRARARPSRRRSRPITGDAGEKRRSGSDPLEAEQMRRPETVRDRDPRRAGQQARGGLVGVGAVTPGAPARGAPPPVRPPRAAVRARGRAAPGRAPAGARAASVAPAASGRSRSGTRGREKARRRARPALGSRPRRAARRIRSRCGPAHSLKRIGRGRIWNVTGVVPSAHAVREDRHRSLGPDLEPDLRLELLDVRVGDVVAVAEESRELRVGARTRAGEHEGVQHAVPGERAG